MHAAFTYTPTGKPDYKREARWIYLNNIRIDWVRDFIGD